MRRAIWCLLLILIAGCSAAWIRGFFTPTKRVLFNINTIGLSLDYAFINRLQNGNTVWSPVGSNWTDGTHFWNASVLNSDGTPTVATNSTITEWGGGFFTPLPSEDGGGPRCFDGYDTGTGSVIKFNNNSGGWTTTTGTQNCAQINSSGQITGSLVNCNTGVNATYDGTQNITVAGSGYWCITLKQTAGGGSTSNQYFVTTGDGTLHYLGVYDVADTPRRASNACSGPSGLCLFRLGYLTPVATAHPGAIRLMKWNDGQNASESRWENRPLPSNAGVGNSSWWCGSLPYGSLAGGPDQYTLATVTGSGCKSGSTPVANQQGELVTALVGSGNGTTALGGITNCEITSITTGNPTTINTNGACLVVGNSGKTVVLYLQNGATGAAAATGALAKLNLFPVTATFVSGTQFTVNFDSSGGGAYTACATANLCVAATYECLNVNSRGCFPVVQYFDGYTSIVSSSAPLAASTYASFVFDANSVARTDGAGNNVFGAWLRVLAGGNGQPQSSVPVEIQTELINELNALYSIGQPRTHMYVTIASLGLLPEDTANCPGCYSTSSDWAINFYNTIMAGANGYSGLCTGCRLYSELTGNETWNPTGLTLWLARQGSLRWGAADPGADFSSYSTLRALWALADIKTASSYGANASRTRFVIAGQGIVGTTNPNTTRLVGHNQGTLNLVNTDAQNPLATGTTFTGTITGGTALAVSGLTGPLTIGYAIEQNPASGNCIITAGSGSSWTVHSLPSTATSTTLGACTNVASAAFTAIPAPMMAFDNFASAPYFDMANAQYITDITQGASDYTTFGAGSAQVAADIVTFVNDIIAGGSSGGITFWESVMASNTTVMAIFGKTAINYEGGLNANPASATWSGTTNAQNFVNLVYQSAAWGAAQQAYFQTFPANPNLELPGIFLQLCNANATPNWEWASGSCNDTFSAGTEGAGLSPTWLNMGSYNAGQPN